MGPLVGVTFIHSVQTYAEASGLNGTAAGVGEAFSPLIGIWAPTFSACEIAAVFLLPFVAIHQVAADRQSGALKIELQHPSSHLTRMAAKALALLGGWLIASFAPAIALALWASYGGHINLIELLPAMLGHTLNAGIAVALAAAAASIVDSPSTAAIVTLAVTVGTWIVSFVAAVRGGVWERVAAYTPTAVVAEFQHGLIRVDTLLVMLTLIVGLLVASALWTRLGVSVRRRAVESVALGVVVTVLILASTSVSASRDLSEDRYNSFPQADEIALKQIRSPLKIVAHLAPEDPRRLDLERFSLSKLRRLLPNVDVQYVSATTIGLFEQTSVHYGEIWYELGDHRTMSRVTTAEGVVEAIYSLSGVEPSAAGEDRLYRGYPLPYPPRHAALMFYGLWPVAVAVAFVMSRRRS